MSSPTPLGSGDGSRPTTDGGTDNIGAGQSFVPGGDGGPAPEQPPPRKAGAQQTRADDSAPLGLHDAVDAVPNAQAPQAARDANADR